MKTEKLYYTDAYIKEFGAVVLSCEERDGYYLAVLDKTAFFPEEGGQYADRGLLNGIAVDDVREKDGQIIHYLSQPLEVGATVHGSIDFDRRFENMQCHTAEHILCGIIHRRFGFDNVGFHLGEDIVTFDINGTLSREELDSVEDEANLAVYMNLPVSASFPSSDELRTLSYRSKLELTEGVRIVTVGDVDACACCAPHVASTGEIGLIKCLDAVSHKGGVRIIMLAGKRALLDYRARYSRERRISALTSTPQTETVLAVEKLLSDIDSMKLRLGEAGLRTAETLACAVPETEGNYLALTPLWDMDSLRAFANLARGRVRGLLVALMGKDGDYKYVITSDSIRVNQRIKEINAALMGKGGGRPDMAQGSFNSTYAEIEKYFKT